MTTWRMAAALGLAGVLSDGTTALAGEVTVPAGTDITFTPGTPNPGQTYMGANGTYTIPNGWHLSYIKLKAYTVKNGKADKFVGERKCGLAENTWAGTITGLTPNTDYIIEVEMRINTDDIFSTDYAIKRIQSDVKTTLP